MVNLILGKSGSGKSTVVDYLQKQYHYKPLLSYTTRPRRYPEEKGHIFITASEEVPNSEIVAETWFDGHHYFATKEQVEEADLYIIDPHGVEILRKHDCDFRTFFINVPDNVLKARVFQRDHSFERFYHDLKNYPMIATDFCINGCQSISEIGDTIHRIIKGS